MEALKLGIIGAGIMGGNHARVLSTIPGVVVTAVSDRDERRLAQLAQHVDATPMHDYRMLIDSVDGVVIAVPSDLHSAIALECIEAGRPALIEKPMATTVAGAEQVRKAALAAAVPILIGHVERFNSAVTELASRAEPALHVEIRRISPYSARINTDVVSDLMVHDLDLVTLLLGGDLEDLYAVGQFCHGWGPDLVEVIMRMSNNKTASLTASRIGQAKHRSIVMTTPDEQVVADLVRQTVTIHRVARSEFVEDDGVRYRQSGVVETPFLQMGEPLRAELQHFVRVCRGIERPIAGVDEGLACVKLVHLVLERLGSRQPTGDTRDQQAVERRMSPE